MLCRHSLSVNIEIDIDIAISSELQNVRQHSIENRDYRIVVHWESAESNAEVSS